MSDTKSGSATEVFAGFARAAADSQSAFWNEMTRMFSESRFPSSLPDANALFAAHRRNLETFSAANKLALEGAQAVARRNMEIIGQTMTELTEQLREISSGEAAPDARAHRQAELVRRAYEHAVANLRELTELIQRSNTETLELLEQRVREAAEEIRGLLGPAGGAAR